jgi:hypothetical protein
MAHLDSMEIAESVKRSRAYWAERVTCSCLRCGRTITVRRGERYCGRCRRRLSSVFVKPVLAVSFGDMS